MKKILLLILFYPSIGLSQPERCDQFERIIDYLENDTTFRDHFKDTSIRLSVDNEVGSGLIWYTFDFEYIAIKYDLDKVNDWRDLDTAEVNSLRREIKEKELSDTSTYHLDCLSDLGVQRKGKIKVNFFRNDSNIVAVWTERIFKRPRHSYGLIYLFSFDQSNKIDRVFNKTWQE